MHFLPPPFLLSCHSQNTRFATTMGQLFLLCRDFGMISGKEDHLGKALKKCLQWPVKFILCVCERKDEIRKHCLEALLPSFKTVTMYLS